MSNVKRVSLRGGGVSDAWHACEPFNANDTLTGDWHKYAPHNGRLDNDETTMLRQWADMARIAPGARFFVVKSYATPIAWAIVYNNGEVERYKVQQRFSVTTSKHWGQLY